MSVVTEGLSTPTGLSVPRSARSHLSIAIEGTAQIGEARRAAEGMARECNLGEDAFERLARVVTELTTLVSTHVTLGGAQRGRILLRPLPDGMEVVAMDANAGDAADAPELRAAEEASDLFDAWSHHGVGTVAMARVKRHRSSAAAAHFSCGGIALPAPGEIECGDGWLAHVQGQRALVAVVDGLGHGPHAATAARMFLDVVVRRIGEAPSQILTAAHPPMKASRGAAAAIVVVDLATGTATMAGVGNISVDLIGPDGRSHGVVSQHGIVGAQMRTVSEQVRPFPSGSTLLMASDGIQTRWRSDAIGPLRERHPMLLAAAAFLLGLRGRDDATAVVLRASP